MINVSLKDNEQVKIEDVAETVNESLAKQHDNTIVNDEFGFEAIYEDDEYTTISGKEYKDMSMATQYNINDFEIGDVITGYPEITIFPNNEKDENGEFKRKSQSIRLRLCDGDEEYVDLYANIPRRDDKGFIENLNKSFNFMRTGFDLCFSFMRWLNEANVITSKGETINRINKINVDNICKKIDSMNWVKVKIVKSNDPAYPSWILLDMKNL